MKMKILAVLACIALTVMIVTNVPLAAAVKGPVMNSIQFRIFESETSLFTALQLPDSEGGVDVMAWPMIKDQYDSVINNKAFTVAPLFESGDFELMWNTNFTSLSHPGQARNPFNYTDFRQAMASLVDKDGVIAGPHLQGFATRVDTQIPRPLMDAWINPNVCFPNYPWEFQATPTRALTILYNGGWYSHTVYPTIDSLVSAYTSGALATAGGTANGVIYPGVDPNGQLYGSDTYSNPQAGQPIPKLVGWVRSNDARKDIGDMFCAMLTKMGITFEENYAASLSVLRPHVMIDYTYDFATLGYGMSSPPNWWYSECTPVGIYPNGPNPYLIDDGNMTLWATAAFGAPNQTNFYDCLMKVQDILIRQAYICSVYSPATYCCYKTGMVGMINVLGYAWQGYGQSQNYWQINCKKNNTVLYTGSPENTPESNIIYVGLYNPPDMINPIFASTVFDSQIIDTIYSWPFGGNPYNNILPGSANTGVPTGGDLPWMLYDWKLETVTDPADPNFGNSNCTYWFRHDITWQDGVPFTVDDFNFTIYTDAVYGDSWYVTGMQLCTDDNMKPYFQKWDDWTCSVQMETPSWLNLYTPTAEILPKHLYENIAPANITEAIMGICTTGLHGVWPGAAALASEFKSNSYGFTFANLQSSDGGKYSWIGTNMFTYRPGSTTAALVTSPGGGITVDAYPNWYMKLSSGTISYKYTWNTNHAHPMGGYYKIGLSDLVMLANAYGFVGTPPSAVSIGGATRSWNSGCDLAAPAGVVGLSDLVTLALHYGWVWGNYTAPGETPVQYPAAEIANGGP
jgi:hypothetical protein